MRQVSKAAVDAIKDELETKRRREQRLKSNKRAKKSNLKHGRAPTPKSEMNLWRESDAERPQPETRKFKDFPICAADRSQRFALDPDNPGVCCNIAGAGTVHLGYGRCKWHGGNTPNGIKSAETEQVAAELAAARYNPTYGRARNIGPHEALLEEIGRTAGAIEWIASQIRSLSTKELFQASQNGMTQSAWLEVYGKERDRLVSVCRAAVSAGCEERTVRLAEDQGRLLATVIRDILFDKSLNLTPQQKSDSGTIVRKHLMSLDAAQKEISAGPSLQTAELPIT